MTIDTSFKMNTHFCCDNCLDTITVQGRDWREATKEIKEEGWIVKKIDDDFVHYCSQGCAND